MGRRNDYVTETGSMKERRSRNKQKQNKETIYTTIKVRQRHCSNRRPEKKKNNKLLRRHSSIDTWQSIFLI